MLVDSKRVLQVGHASLASDFAKVPVVEAGHARRLERWIDSQLRDEGPGAESLGHENRSDGA